MLVYCAGEISSSISSSRIPQEAWRAGDEARLKQRLLYMQMEESAYIHNIRSDFDMARSKKPYTPYDSVEYIEKGVVLKIERITKSALPNSVGGTRVMARILNGPLSGKEAQIRAGDRPNLLSGGEYYMVPDPEYFEIISRNSQDGL